jgi:hypothetical protein
VWLAALSRADADEAFEGQAHHDVDPTLAGGRDAGVAQQAVDFRARQMPAPLKGAQDELSGARQDLVIDLEPPKASGDAGHRTRGAEPEHPAHVLGGDEVQRPAHGPCPDDGAAGDGVLHLCPSRFAQAEADGPERRRVILRLDSTESSDDGGGLLDPR